MEGKGKGRGREGREDAFKQYWTKYSKRERGKGEWGEREDWCINAWMDEWMDGWMEWLGCIMLR
jgi:hypothetical protein